MKHVTVKTKLFLLTGAAVVGLFVFGVVSYTTLDTIKVGGPIANELRSNIELGGDLSPTTLHIGPARLIVYRMLDETDGQQLQEETAEFQRFEKGYAEAHARWIKELPEGKLKQIVAVKVHEPAVKYMHVVEQELIPALLRGDKAKAEEIRRAIKPVFLASEAAALEGEQLRGELVTQSTARAGSAVRASLLTMAGIGLVAGFGICVLGLVIARSILGPLGKTLLALQALADGDLRQQIDVESSDEIGAMGHALNQAIGNVAQAIQSISNTADQVANASAELSCSSNQQARCAETQEHQTSQVAVAMQEMSATVAQVSENSHRAAQASCQAAETAHKGGSIVEETLSKMRAMAASVQSSARKMVELGNSSDQIGRIAGVIDDIADQTNLLALNAAIEAARAGEQGRGFAVVADEVRKLAERTATATKEIAQMIKKIQDETKTAAVAMETGTEQVQEGVTSTVRAGETLQQIIHMSEQVGEMITHIAIAATEQSKASEEINRNMEQIETLVKESAAGAQQSARACQDLSELVINMRSTVHNFKLQDDGSRGGAAATTDSGARFSPAGWWTPVEARSTPGHLLRARGKVGNLTAKEAPRLKATCRARMC